MYFALQRNLNEICPEGEPWLTTDDHKFIENVPIQRGQENKELLVASEMLWLGAY